MMEVLNYLSALLLLSLLPPSLSEVVNKFNPKCSEFFLDQTTPRLPGILLDGIVLNPDQDQNRYKPICQKYNDRYRFATLYDTTNKIPVFSAYTYTGYIKGERREEWMIEPQLNNINDINDNINDIMIKDTSKEGKDPYPDHQAGLNDYKGKMGEKKLSRGHLFPVSHAHDQETKDSTFTLTNIVPQVESFNGGSWSTMEGDVLKALNDCKDADNIKAYVVTGAVPSESNTLNKRVNIPSLLWTAYCCKNNQGKWVAGAHWGENKEETGKETLPSNTLAELYEMLSKEGDKRNKNNVLVQFYSYIIEMFYYKGVQVFPEKCPIGLNPNTAPSWFGSIVSTLSNLKNSVMNRIG